MTPERRAYILSYLSKAATGTAGNWIRISEHEFDDFGGRWFFEGCRCVYQHDEQWFTTKPGTRGWVVEGRVQLPWKIEAPRTGWQSPTYNYGFTTTTNSTITLTNSTITSHSITNEGKPSMEHHIKRDELIKVVSQNKEAYELVLKRAQALYRDEIEKKTELHVQGQLPVNQINVSDQNGTITIPSDMTETFDQQIRALELDARDVIILDDGDYQVFVNSQATNLTNLGAVTKRLEELP